MKIFFNLVILYIVSLYIVFWIVDFEDALNISLEALKQLGFVVLWIVGSGIPSFIILSTIEHFEKSRSERRKKSETFFKSQKSRFLNFVEKVVDYIEVLYWKYVNRNKNVAEEIKNMLIGPNEAYEFGLRTQLIQYLIQSQRLSFVDLVEIYKDVYGFFDAPYNSGYTGTTKKSCLNFLFHYRKRTNKELRSNFLFHYENFVLDLYEQKLIKLSDLEYMFKRITFLEELEELVKDHKLLLKMLVKRAISFEDLIHKIQEIQKTSSSRWCLSAFLSQSESLNILFDKGLLSDDDLKLLLQMIDQSFLIKRLCASYNKKLVFHILDQNLLDDSMIDKFDELLLEESSNKNEEMPFFNLIYRNIVCRETEQSKNAKKLKIDEEFYSVLNRVAVLHSFSGFDFTLDEKLKLYEVYSNDDRAQQRLKHLIENHLESTFKDLEELMKHLKKKVKKHSLNI